VTVVQALAMRWRCIALLCLCALGGCERCSGRVPEELRVAGPTPYVRCLAAEAPEARQWRVGGAQFALSDRELALSGLPDSVRIAVFAGPAFASASPQSALHKVVAARPRVAIVVGSIGDQRQQAINTLRYLAETEIITLVLAGGRDRWDDYRAAFVALDEKQSDRVIDISTLHSVRIGSESFVVVAGAAQGRYARDASACGFGDQDLDQIASQIGSKDDTRRWLLSWQAPAGGGALSVGKTSRGLQTGDSLLARFAQRVGARGGLFAWPDGQVMRPRAHRESLPLPPGVIADDLRMVVPRLIGPFIERDDGTRVPPGFALVILTKAGMLVEEH
jgi:hypothetical protein